MFFKVELVVSVINLKKQIENFSELPITSFYSRGNIATKV